MKDHPSVKLHPMVWTRDMDLDTLAALRLIPMELATLLKKGRNSSYWPDCFLENFSIIHARGSTTYAMAAPVQHAERIHDMWDFLHKRLQDRPLTWSDRGATTGKGHLDQLLVNAGNWGSSAVSPKEEVV